MDTKEIVEGHDEKQRREDGEREVKKSRRKIVILVSITGLLLLIGGVVLALFLTGVLGAGVEPADPEDLLEEEVVVVEEEERVETYYSVLTGLPISDPAENELPTFCVQIPNGTDGARPQVGLNRAGVIFEAIAERGITRFAAIFQNVADITAIGPMRSLRLYYLQWDAPFDCTIVHDGGADDALAAVKSYKDFTGFGAYVWRSATNNILNRRWNNEFTSGELLLSYNAKRGYGGSNVKGFTRNTPEDALRVQVDSLATNPLDIDSETEESTSGLKIVASKIRLKFGNMPNYNPVYDYDAESNTYLRSYESGAKHTIYDCAGQSGKLTPEKVCQEKQLAPSVVIAMMVDEKLASDSYHENITTIGSGKAYIFQGGMVIEGSWKKAAVGEQISFYDADGKEVALAPGQVMISAVPNYGSVSYE